MKSIYSAAVEILGLFVEDGSLALAILAWVSIAVLLVAHTAGHANWTGPALFAGLAFVLIDNVVRSARRGPK